MHDYYTRSYSNYNDQTRLPDHPGQYQTPYHDGNGYDGYADDWQQGNANVYPGKMIYSSLLLTIWSIMLSRTNLMT